MSALWHLLDERAGPEGLMPQTCDGEGFPARAIVLLADGQARERFASWDDLAESGGRAGGAVRGSYREPPAAGPANLVARARRPVPQTELLAALTPGFWVDHPAGEVRLDPGSDRFALRAAAVTASLPNSREDKEFLNDQSFDSVGFIVELIGMLSQVHPEQHEWIIEEAKKLVFQSVNRQNGLNL